MDQMAGGLEVDIPLESPNGEWTAWRYKRRYNYEILSVGEYAPSDLAAQPAVGKTSKHSVPFNCRLLQSASRLGIAGKTVADWLIAEIITALHIRIGLEHVIRNRA